MLVVVSFLFANCRWHEFDDSTVRPVDADVVENVQAYMLFYKYALVAIAVVQIELD